ncbi:MAG: PEP-CTERM sorting domain-containing protein, partial [Myxococcales bacterium]|nr:PEP-CTERM sorting domain-containing protein [Myxococcales bacterium]
YTGTTFNSSDNSLLGQAPRWSLDNGTNGDVTIVLEAAICGAPGGVPGQCGSGHGDMVMSIQLSAIDLTGVSATDYLVFYSEYRFADDGFEEWKRGPGQPIPEPHGVLLFGAGMTCVAAVLRRRR